MYKNKEHPKNSRFNTFTKADMNALLEQMELDDKNESEVLANNQANGKLSREELEEEFTKVFIQLIDLLKQKKFIRPSKNDDVITVFKETIIPTDAHVLLDTLYSITLAMYEPKCNLELYYDQKFHITLWGFNLEKINAVYNEAQNCNISVRRYGRYILLVTRNLLNDISELTLDEKGTLLKVLFDFFTEKTILSISEQQVFAKLCLEARFPNILLANKNSLLNNPVVERDQQNNSMLVINKRNRLEDNEEYSSSDDDAEWRERMDRIDSEFPSGMESIRTREVYTQNRDGIKDEQWEQRKRLRHINTASSIMFDNQLIEKKIIRKDSKLSSIPFFQSNDSGKNEIYDDNIISSIKITTEKEQKNIMEIKL
ncbi:MAG: hypothetical protein ACK4PR_04290 [Gammaproteobacteria bacterium]